MLEKSRGPGDWSRGRRGRVLGHEVWKLVGAGLVVTVERRGLSVSYSDGGTLWRVLAEVWQDPFGLWVDGRLGAGREGWKQGDQFGGCGEHPGEGGWWRCKNQRAGGGDQDGFSL